MSDTIIGMLSETCNKWERRAPLTPSHCARLLHSGKAESGVARIVVQPSTKRIYHDALYEDVGCEVSEDLSECGLIVGVKQPKLEMILPDRGYAFFSHTHKAQKENMPLLDKIQAERSTLFDYELIVGDNGKRLLAFGKYAGRAGMIDFLHGLGQRYISFGYSTPFLSIGASYMYPSLAASKGAVVSVGEEISTLVSQGAQEIFKLLPHKFVKPSELPELFEQVGQKNPHSLVSERDFQVYGCVVTSKDMVEPKDPNNIFNKVDYYSHPENYIPVFHEKIAPYASVIVNCMYWEQRFPRLLTTKQLQELMNKRCPLVGIADITCDIGGSIEFVNQATTIDSPFIRYDSFTDSYHNDMDGEGMICSAVEILPTEFAKEASQHFGNILSQFVGHLASTKDFEELPTPLKLACIVNRGELTSLYEYIPRMRESASDELSETLPDSHPNKKKYSLSVRADELIDSLTPHASKGCNNGMVTKEPNKSSLTLGKIQENVTDEIGSKMRALIIGAGQVSAAEFLASVKGFSCCLLFGNYMGDDELEVIVAFLYLKDAKEVSLHGPGGQMTVMVGVVMEGKGGDPSRDRRGRIDLPQLVS